MRWSLLRNKTNSSESLTVNNRTLWERLVEFGMSCAWLLSIIVLGFVFSGRAVGDDTTTATKKGGITIYSDKRGTDGTDLKTGPITTSTTSSKSQDETVVTSTRIGNVTEMTGSKGTKSTVVTTGPITSGQIHGKAISVIRIGENVALGADESGGTIKALQAGNQVVVQKSGNVSPSEVRIAVQLLQEPVVERTSVDGVSDMLLLPFTGVEASGDVTVEVECGREFGIVVENKKMHEDAVFEVTDGVLHIKCVGTGFDERFPRKIVVKLPNLIEVTARDEAQLVAKNVTGERCVVVSRGGGKVEISGKVATVQCRVSSGGQVFGKNLRTGRMSVRLDGDGEVHCNAEQELVVVITGKGIVWSHGQPGLVTRKITGGGELRFEK